MPPLATVLSQHAEEAAFLWLLRDDAVRAPHYLLADLARLDDRVEAHLDGLRVAGDPGWELVRTALAEHGEPGEVFAVAVLAFEGGQQERIQEVMAAGLAKPETARAVASAVGWLTYARAAGTIKGLLGSPDPAARRLGVAAAAIHRQNPGRPLAEALADPAPALRGRACRAVGEMGLVGHDQAVRRSLAGEDEVCRFWAAWALALLTGDRDALSILRKAAGRVGPLAERAVQVAARRMNPTEVRAWMVELGKDPTTARLAVVAAGAMGDPEVIPWLIDRMAAPELARVAGEAFSMITGAHIDYDKLDGEEPEGFEAGPTEDPDDENVAMDPDENLPWPNAEAVRTWWEGRKGGFSAGTRYLVGRSIGPESLQQVLREGYQRQRAAAALELAIAQPGQPLFEVRAPAFRQQKFLGTAGV